MIKELFHKLCYDLPLVVYQFKYLMLSIVYIVEIKMIEMSNIIKVISVFYILNLWSK